jgi:hypothetical protein
MADIAEACPIFQRGATGIRRNAGGAWIRAPDRVPRFWLDPIAAIRSIRQRLPQEKSDGTRSIVMA